MKVTSATGKSKRSFSPASARLSHCSDKILLLKSRTETRGRSGNYFPILIRGQVVVPKASVDKNELYFLYFLFAILLIRTEAREGNKCSVTVSGHPLKWFFKKLFPPQKSCLLSGSCLNRTGTEFSLTYRRFYLELCWVDAQYISTSPSWKNGFMARGMWTVLSAAYFLE